MCCSSMSEWWYEPSWGVDCEPNLIRLIAKGYAQIVSDVAFDVANVLGEKKMIYIPTGLSKALLKACMLFMELTQNGPKYQRDPKSGLFPEFCKIYLVSSCFCLILVAIFLHNVRNGSKFGPQYHFTPEKCVLNKIGVFDNKKLIIWKCNNRCKLNKLLIILGCGPCANVACINYPPVLNLIENVPVGIDYSKYRFLKL